MSVLPHYLESYKSAYSHPGLEAMYALETVDIKTVRLLNHPGLEPSPAKPLEAERVRDAVEETEQLEFDFGGELSLGIKPLILEEPIQVLRLSSQIEKILLSCDKLVLRDLLKINPHEWVFVRGIGQGHLEEIQTRLNDYLKGHALRLSRCVDFACLLRILIGSMNRIEAALLLDKFNLAHFISLTHAEKMELRRFSAEEKSKLSFTLRESLKRSRAAQTLEKVALEINQVFVKPWMQRRGGLATYAELMERIERVSKVPSQTLDILAFISHIFLEGQFLCQPYLIEVRPGLYSQDETIAAAYQMVIQKALTYFYHPTSVYPLQQLISLLQKEFACSWMNFSDSFLIKSLEFSSDFQLSKNLSGSLIVKLV